MLVVFVSRFCVTMFQPGQYTRSQNRQHDLLPLPHPPVTHINVSHLSRGCQQRARRRSHVDSLTAEVISDFNSLHLGRDVPHEEPSSISASQWFSIALVREAVVRFGAPPAELTGAEALTQLRAKQDERGCPGTRHPLDLARCTQLPGICSDWRCRARPNDLHAVV